MKTFRRLIMVGVSLFFIVSASSMVWSGQKARPAIGQADERVQREIRDAQRRLYTPAYLDLSVEVKPIGGGGLKVYVKNIGTKGAGTSTYSGYFMAKGPNTPQGKCFKKNISHIVPGPGGENTKTYSASEIAQKLGTLPVAYYAYVNLRPKNLAEKTYNNNEAGNKGIYNHCK